MADLASDQLRRRVQYDAAIADAREKERKAAISTAVSTDRGKPGKLASDTLKDEDRKAAAKLDKDAADRLRAAREAGPGMGSPKSPGGDVISDKAGPGGRSLSGSGGKAVAPGKAMAQGGPAVAKPVGRPGLPPKLSSDDISAKPAKAVPITKKVKATEVKQKKPAAKKKAAKKDHSGDPRYTTPPFVNKSGTGGGSSMTTTSREARLARLKKMSEAAKKSDAEARAARARPKELSQGTGKDWMKRRGVKTDRR